METQVIGQKTHKGLGANPVSISVSRQDLTWLTIFSRYATSASPSQIDGRIMPEVSQNLIPSILISNTCRFQSVAFNPHQSVQKPKPSSLART